MTRTTQLITLFGAATLAMLMTAGVQAAHVVLSGANELYPVIGGPLGTPLPDEYYDIARDPQDLPSEPLADFAEITIFAYDHTSAGGDTETALAPENFGDPAGVCDAGARPCWAKSGQEFSGYLENRKEFSVRPFTQVLRY